MAETSNTLIMGATPEDVFWADKQDILTDPTVYFLDRRPSGGPRFIQSSVLGPELVNAAKECPVKFQHIVVDVGTWRHFFEDGVPNIGAITYMLTPTGKIFVPQTMSVNPNTGKINNEVILREKLRTEQLFTSVISRKLNYSLLSYDTIENINPAVDLVASRMIPGAEKHLEKSGEVFEVKFHVGSRVAAGGAKLRSRKSKRKIRKLSRKLRRK